MKAALAARTVPVRFFAEQVGGQPPMGGPRRRGGGREAAGDLRCVIAS